MAITRNTSLDIDLGVGVWQGGASDGTTFWVVDDKSNYARAWTIDTRVKDSSKDINLGYGAWAGVVSSTNASAAILWFIDRRNKKAIARTASSQNTDTTKDIDLGDGRWHGGVSDGTTIWFINNANNMAIAWTISTLERNSDKDISLGAGMWTGGISATINSTTTLWFIDWYSSTAKAFTTSGNRDSTKDIALGAGGWFGGMVDSTNLWFINSNADTAVAYSESTIEAPTLSITNITSLAKNQSRTFTVTPSDGTYDAIEYAWSVEREGGGISLDTTTGTSVELTTPNVSGIDREVTLRCTATVTKTDGTSATVAEDETFMVIDRDIDLGSGDWTGGSI